MSAASLPASPRRNRVVWTVLWLAALALLGVALIVSARRTEKPRPGLVGLVIVLSCLLTWGWAVAVSRARRRTVFRGLRTIIMLLILFACLEVPAALKLVHWGVVLGRLTGRVDYLDSAFVADPELAFRRRPNEQWSGRPATGEEEWDLDSSQIQPITFTTDHRGYRNAGDLDRADVALIGDSFVEGYRVSDEQTTARVLEQRLSRPVANLGVAGYGPMQELVVLKQEGVRRKPAVVVWFFFEGNDLYNDEDFEAFLTEQASRADLSVPPLRQSQPKPSFTVNALNLLSRRIHALVSPRKPWPYFGHLSLAGGEGQKIYILDKTAMIPWRDYEADCWKRSRKALQEGADLCRREGIHLLLCYVPTPFRVYRPLLTFPPDSPCRDWDVWPLPQLFADFCRSADVAYLDLTGPLQEEVRRGRNLFNGGDVHWNPDGHALVADRLARELRERGWLTDGQAARSP